MDKKETFKDVIDDLLDLLAEVRRHPPMPKPYKEGAGGHSSGPLPESKQYEEDVPPPLECSFANCDYTSSSSNPKHSHDPHFESGLFKYCDEAACAWGCKYEEKLKEERIKQTSKEEDNHWWQLYTQLVISFNPPEAAQMADQALNEAKKRGKL